MRFSHKFDSVLLLANGVVCLLLACWAFVAAWTCERGGTE
jgi:hypothetical protein